MGSWSERWRHRKERAEVDGWWGSATPWELVGLVVGIFTVSSIMVGIDVWLEPDTPDTPGLFLPPPGFLESAFPLEIGDCFDDPADLVPCGDGHDKEVYFQFQVGDYTLDPFPGAPVLAAEADSRCLSEFEVYVDQSPRDSALGISTIVPTYETWGSPRWDHMIHCAVHALDHSQLVGSARNSGW